MKKYRVVVINTEEYEIYVDAESEEEAERKSMEMWDDGIVFDCFDTNQEVRVEEEN